MRDMWLTNVGDLADFLEAEIAAGRNPTTPAMWEDCMRRFAETGGAQKLGATDMTPGYIAGSLRDEGVNARVLKPEPKEKKDA